MRTYSSTQLRVPQMIMLALSILITLAPRVAARCDYCALDNGFTLPWATPFERREYPACQQYRDNACCSYDTVQKILSGGLYGPEYDVGKCSAVGKPMSSACRSFFIAEACAYECDPNLGKYRRHEDCDPDLRWQMYNAPLSAAVCRDWYSACKNDYVPSCGASGVPCSPEDGISAGSALSIGMLNATAATCSRTFGQIYGNYSNPAKAFCNQLYEGAFQYKAEVDDAFVFNFTVGEPNPNDRVNAHLGIDNKCANITQPDPATCPGATRPKDVVPTGCQICQVRNIYPLLNTTNKEVATPETNLGVCQKYANNSCCAPEVAAAIPHGKLYGEQYVWDRCDPITNRTMSNRCREWFRAEACLYECDVQTGKYRKYDNCVDERGDQNMWKIENMPLRASECDQFYEDCYDDYFCTCLEGECSLGITPRSFFSLPSLQCNEDNCRTFGEVYANGSELCELLWDGSFHYETEEADAYSMVWDPTRTKGINPNSLINPYRQFPPTCPGVRIDVRQCPAKIEPKIPVEVVDDIILGDLNITETQIILQAEREANTAPSSVASAAVGG